ncbi:MAG TPA: M20/M25/M40 family metallo-hydrolase [Candidatus Dormibacteraeota bacterium]|nr:M20/M25/M40 family metallo-hydrolase [Candidatus Dormibacteraeota bacterium]
MGLLTELVGIPSPTGAADEAADWLVRQLQERGVPARRDQSGNVLGEVEPTSNCPESGDIYLLGHIDTVEGFWPPVLDDGRLHGRGASDAKGPLAAFTAALLRARDSSELRRRVTLLAAIDEEGASQGARHLAATLPSPAYLVVGEPSGAARVVIGYRGNLRCTVRVHAAVHHSSRPEATAAELGVEAWEAIRGLLGDWNGSRRGFDAVDGHLLEMDTSSDGLRSSARLAVSFRLPNQLTPAQLAEMLQVLLPRASVEVLSSEQAVALPRTGPLPATFARAIRGLGGDLGWQRRLATSDLNVVMPIWGCPAVVYGPGNAELDHTPNESIGLNDFGFATAVLRTVLAQL